MEKKKKQELFEATDADVFKAEDLFAIQGGEDEDFDEDCYLSECVVSSNTCFSPKTDCYFVM
jgi:hypothetical protein